MRVRLKVRAEEQERSSFLAMRRSKGEEKA
jgi:hypothetical protein